MDKNFPLFSLDIIPNKPLSSNSQDGSTITAVLRLNKTEPLVKGTLDYCVDIRREILFNRGFVVPQDWELEWHRDTGPIWTPEKMPNIHMWCQQNGLFNDPDEPTKCTKWASELNEDHYFSQTVADDCPILAENGQNGFKYLTFDGSNEYMVIPKVHHTDHPLSGQDTTCDFNPGATSGSPAVAGQGDFVVGLVVDGNVDSQEQSNRGVVTNFSKEGWALEKNTSDGATVDHDGVQMLNVASTYDDPEIIIMAKISGTTSLRQSGESPTASAIASKDCTVDYSLTAVDTGRGQLGRAGTTKYASMHLYEFVIAKGNDITLEDIKKLEGYFAAKYNIAVSSDNSDFSSTAPPRQGAV